MPRLINSVGILGETRDVQSVPYFPITCLARIFGIMCFFFSNMNGRMVAFFPNDSARWDSFLLLIWCFSVFICFDF